MRINEFIQLVQSSMPSRKELEEYGLTNKEIEDIQMTYRCKRRETTTVKWRPSSELERLVSEYDCSTIEISLVRFSSHPEWHHQGVVVGFWEADPIVVLKNREVVAFDHAKPDSICAPCAVNSERFLDAIAWLVEARASKTLWRGRGIEIAGACAEKAGGSAYQHFFRSLCAFFD